jgi:hypothetical protein
MPLSDQPSRGSTYTYTGRDRAGRVITGTTDGASLQAVVRRLRTKGYFVRVRLQPAPRPVDERVLRIGAAILEQAERDRASCVCLRGSGMEPCTVHQRIGETCQEAMRLPFYIWHPLCSHYAALAGVKLGRGTVRGLLCQTVLNRPARYVAVFRRNSLSLCPLRD